jgi:hypothetical protein
MIRAFRRSLLLFATTAIVLLSALTMTALPLLHGGDDPACDRYAAVHDSSRHGFRDGRSAPTGAQHCMACHWSQWTRAIHDDAPTITPECGSALVANPWTGEPLADSISLSVARAPPLG